MGLLDRFKSQPRWKHPDPGVRLAGVQELPEEDQDLLAAIAREDADPRVRRAAVSKLGSVAALADTIRQDADPQVREEAAGVLLDIALGAYEAAEAASLAAVDGLTGLPAADAEKQLVLVAKSARVERVAREALERLGADPRALGTVARRAEHAGIRLAALARLTDFAEIASTALRSDYKDVALAAVERVEDPAALRAAAARAKSPAAQRRARAKVRVIDEQEAAAAAAEAKRLAAIEARRQSQRDLCRLVEGLVAPSDWDLARARLAEAEAGWTAFGADVEPDLARRFGEASAAAHAALARHEAERAAREQEARARAEQAARRAALCARVEALPADEVEGSLDAIEAEWQALPPLDEPRLIARFEAACRGARDRARSAAAMAADLEQLGTLAAALEAAAGERAYPASAEARARVKELKEQWRAVPEPLRGDARAAEARERWAAAEARLAEREAEARESRTRESREAESRGERAARALEALAAKEDAALTLRTVEHALRNARAAAELLERVSRSPERDALRQRLETAMAAMLPRAQALRDADDWQRWANAAVQEQLCQRMEALRAEENPAKAVQAVHALLAEWQTVALGPRDGGQALWRRFMAARDEVRRRAEPFLAEQARARTENLQKKHALCERAEALADSTDWIRTADAIKALQAEWKSIGAGPRRGEQAAWERFRTACDRFFKRRHEDLAHRKQEWSANQAQKEALCARAEALADSTDWEAAAAELKRLQSEWKAAGPVRRSKSEALWRRFHEACDRFFERYKHRHDTDLVARESEREALVARIEALAADANGNSDRLAAMRDLRARWEAAPPLPRERLAPLRARVDQALVTFARTHPDIVRGSELDVDENLRRLDRLCRQAEQLAEPEAETKGASPAAILATQLREALAANTIGGREGGDGGKRRALEQETRQLQAEWSGVGYVPEPLATPLAERFRRALRRALDQRDGRSLVQR